MIVALFLMALIGLGVAVYLMVSGVMLILGGASFNAGAAIFLGVICLAAGGFIGHAAIKVAPINVELKVLQ